MPMAEAATSRGDSLVRPVGLQLGEVALDARHLGVKAVGHVRRDMDGIQVNAVIDAVGRWHGEIHAGGAQGFGHVDAETARPHAVKEAIGPVRLDADGHVVREGGIVGGQLESGCSVVADGNMVGVAV